jgi:hypothetical protein
MSSDAETVEFTIKVTGDEAGGPFVAAIRADKKDNAGGSYMRTRRAGALWSSAMFALLWRWQSQT